MKQIDTFPSLWLVAHKLYHVRFFPFMLLKRAFPLEISRNKTKDTEYKKQNFPEVKLNLFKVKPHLFLFWSETGIDLSISVQKHAIPGYKICDYIKDGFQCGRDLPKMWILISKIHKYSFFKNIIIMLNYKEVEKNGTKKEQAKGLGFCPPFRVLKIIFNFTLLISQLCMCCPGRQAMVEY